MKGRPGCHLVVVEKVLQISLSNVRSIEMFSAEIIEEKSLVFHALASAQFQ